MNLKLFLWMLVCVWTVFPLSISGIWFLKYYILVKKSSGFNEINVPASGNRSRDEIQNKHTNSNNKTKTHGNREVDELSKVDHVDTSANLLTSTPSLKFSRTMKL